MNDAKIVAITKPLIENVNSAEEFIAYCARVSNPNNQMNNETAPKLLKYCLKNKHWSIFEMINIVMVITTTRDIARQILRHRSFSFQEFSQRYADPTKSLGFSLKEARLQDKKNRQNSIEIQDDELDAQWKNVQMNIIQEANYAYDWAVSKGIAKEQARAVLPEGLINSTMYMSGSLRSWIHWIQVRNHPATQKEHRYIAENATKEIITHFPVLKDSINEMIDENINNLY